MAFERYPQKDLSIGQRIDPEDHWAQKHTQNYRETLLGSLEIGMETEIGFVLDTAGTPFFASDRRFHFGLVAALFARC
jgi:hypothetical protein